MSCFTRGRPLRQPPPPPPGWPPGSRETVKSQGMPAGGSQRLAGAQRPSLSAAHPPNRGEALPRMSYAATRGACSGGAGGGASDCRSGSSSAAAVRPALRTGREAPAPSVGSGGYRREEAARSGGYGRGPAPPPRDLRPPREAGSGPPRHYEQPASAARAQQLERGSSSTALAGLSTPALASGTRAAERGSSLSAARRGEERRGEEPPAGRGEPVKCAAAPPRRHLQPHASQAACPRGGGCNPVQCVRGHSVCPKGCFRPMCPGATSATVRTRRLLAPGSARREIGTPTRRPRETRSTSAARVALSRSCARHAWCAARTHGTHPRHAPTARHAGCTHGARTMHARCTHDAQLHTRATHNCAHARLAARPGSRPARHSAPSFCPSSLHRQSALVSVCRCGSRVTAPVSSTPSPTDCATARRRTRCDGRWPRSYSPFDPNPDPLPNPIPILHANSTPRPNIPTPTPASGGLTLTLTLTRPYQVASFIESNPTLTISDSPLKDWARASHRQRRLQLHAHAHACRRLHAYGRGRSRTQWKLLPYLSERALTCTGLLGLGLERGRLLPTHGAGRRVGRRH